jgi:hypothetical protein
METLSDAAYSIPLRAIVTKSHKPRDILELKLKKGKKLLLLEPKGEWWYIARLQNDKEGWVPAKHIRILPQLDKHTTKKLFLEWYEKKERALGNLQRGMELPHGEVRIYKLDGRTFPFPPTEINVCDMVTCKFRKQEKGLGACVHDMETFFKAGLGEVYGAKSLWAESLIWHPDRIERRYQADWLEEGKKVGGEMYVILGELIAEARKKEGVD